MTATLAAPSTIASGHMLGASSVFVPTGRRPFVPTAEQRQVIEHRRGRLRVLAGPGTGKTATIAAAVAARIADGVDPGAILVLTFARRAASELAARIAGLVETTTVQPLVRTLHSYCYAVVRSAADSRGEPPPRMLGAGESDLVVRDLLAGHLETGATGWPEHLRPALEVPRFATDLREFLLRSAEREIGPSELTALARRHARAEWQAVAAFMTEYRDVTALRQAGGRFGAAFDQAELTVAALDLLSDPRIRAGEQRRIRRIFVDEYQDVDPAQARLIEVLADGADELVVVGDPDQAIYGFRGALPAAITAVDADDTVALTVSRRLPPELVRASRRLAGRIPGPAAHRALTSASPEGEDDVGDVAGELEVRVLPHPSAQAAFVADELRRAHLGHGVPWSRMAVLLRSPAASAAEFRRALSNAGVPTVAGTSELPLAAQPLVRGLLAVLRAGVDVPSLNGEVAAEILSSPVGGFDVVTLRRLRRAVRSGGGGSGPTSQVLAALLRAERDVPKELPSDLAGPLRRVVELIGIARTSSGVPAAEDALWRVWSRTGLARRLAAASERGGREGERADAMLDGVVGLFDLAADLAVRLPGAGVPGLLDLVAGQQIPSSGAAGGPAAGSQAEAVTILSAHAAKGLEWDTVVVAGVQQGAWPDLRGRADLLGLADALDAADGVLVPRGVRAAQILAEERRLFYVAATRARRRLVVTAVEDDEFTPSPFLFDLVEEEGVAHGWPRDRTGSPRRSLHLAGLLADLRGAVGDRHRTAGERDAAAAALARLAAAGVRGAHPDDWLGMAAVTTDAPMVPPSETVVLSPSQVEAAVSCPLRAVLTRNGGGGQPTSAQLLGVLVHAIANGVTQGVGDAELAATIQTMLDGQEHLPAWERTRTARLIASMTAAARAWMERACVEREFVGSEVSVDVVLPSRSGNLGTEGDGAEQRVRVVGRADWVSRDDTGRVVVSDFKTSAAVPSRAEVAEHAQLAVYQVAAALGAFDTGGDAGGRAGSRAGGGELVMLRSGTPKTLHQDPLGADGLDDWLTTLRDAAEAVSGASLIAREGAGCERCPVRSSCPLRPEGRPVTA